MGLENPIKISGREVALMGKQISSLLYFYVQQFIWINYFRLFNYTSSIAYLEFILLLSIFFYRISLRIVYHQSLFIIVEYYCLFFISWTIVAHSICN